jgi:hypothetical protein
MVRASPGAEEKGRRGTRTFDPRLLMARKSSGHGGTAHFRRFHYASCPTCADEEHRTDLRGEF